MRIAIAVWLLLTSPQILAQAEAQTQTQTQTQSQSQAQYQGYRQVDACFVLDTTGSMSSTIKTAKEKIWFIANEIARARSNPRLRLCLMAYRDREDSYVTRLFPLTDELDQIHLQLGELTADGGGDTPEAVYQALHETVHQAGWRGGGETLRVIFLIGDAPPKIYPDEPQYPEILAAASARQIVINPVLIGNARSTRESFEQLEREGSGSLLHLPAVDSERPPSTPLDQDLVALSARLNATVVPYGSDSQRDETLQHAQTADALADVEQIERLAFGNASERVLHRRGDLIQDLAQGHLSLAALEPGQLPLHLRSMNADELARALGEIKAEREALQTLIGSLLEQRRTLLEHRDSRNSFAYQVSQVLLRQL